MENPNLHWKGAVYSRYFDGDSIKTDGYRYTEWSKADGYIYARMLYDHIADPFENVNISELSENQDLVKSLSKLLQRVKF